ncbi:MAG: hypothetical protein FWC68_05415 [Oscillospiraceae bacterium]|nr:hypothetical protein [Oscillospiraceae bacterium]
MNFWNYIVNNYEAVMIISAFVAIVIAVLTYIVMIKPEIAKKKVVMSSRPTQMCIYDFSTKEMTLNRCDPNVDPDFQAIIKEKYQRYFDDITGKDLKEFLYIENGLDSQEMGFKFIRPSDNHNICVIFGKTSKSSDICLCKEAVVFKLSPPKAHVAKIKLSQISVIWKKGTQHFKKRIYRNRSYIDYKKQEASFDAPFQDNKAIYFLALEVQDKYAQNSFCISNGPTYDEFILHFTFTILKDTKSIKIYYNVSLTPKGKDCEDGFEVNVKPVSRYKARRNKRRRLIRKKIRENLLEIE